MTPLETWLQQRGKTKDDLAREVGMTWEHVHRIVTGQTKPGARFVLAFAQTQGLTLDAALRLCEEER